MQLYALCDQELLDRYALSLDDFVALALQHDAKVIQYRNKHGDIAQMKHALITLRQQFEGFLIINDAYDLVDYCDGVHVGQDDMQNIHTDPKQAVAILRDIIGHDKLLGLSTHNEHEILRANELDLNYIGLGAYRNTTTKSVSNVLGEELDTLAARSTHPVAAIGGVTLGDTFLHVTYKVIGSGLLER